MWHIYTREYYAAIKKDEFMSFAETWMKLETIILSKLTQEQKTKHRTFSLINIIIAIFLTFFKILFKYHLSDTNSPASTSQAAGTTDAYHHAQLICSLDQAIITFNLDYQQLPKRSP
ncbi:retrotransposable element ORF2 protein [Plecturocebus cupreus]